MGTESGRPEDANSTGPEGQTRHPEGEGSKEPTIAYETHRKLLSERKRDAERMRAYEEELQQFKEMERQRQEAEAEKKGEFHKVVDTYKKENAELRARVEQNEKNDIARTKMNAFLRRLNGNIKNDDYLIHVNIGEIGYDPHTGEIDEVTLDREVKRYQETYPEAIAPKSNAKMPNFQGTGNSNVKVTKKSLRGLSDSQLKQVWLSGKFKDANKA